MSKVVLTQINKGDPLVVDKMNASIGEWNSRANDIDEENVRQEGIDRRNIASEAVIDSPSTSASQIDSVSTSYSMPAVSPTDSTAKIPDSDIGSFTYNSSDQVALKVNLSLHYEAVGLFIAGSGSGNLSSSLTSIPKWKVAIYYKESASMSSFAKIDETVRTITFGLVAINKADRIPLSGSLSIAHNFTALGSTSTSSLSFNVRVWQDTNSLVLPITINNFNFYAQRILR